MTEPITLNGRPDLAAQLRRLSERLDSQIAEVYAARGETFQPHWQSVVAALATTGEASATSLAMRLGVSRATVSRHCRELVAAGLILARADRTDARFRVFALSSAGRRSARRLQTVWQAVDDATAALIGELAPDLRCALHRLEDALDGVSLAVRIEETPR